MTDHLYLADSFQYYFDDDFFRQKFVKEYNLFDKVYQDSIMWNIDSYADLIKDEANSMKNNSFYDEEKSNDCFKYSFENNKVLPEHILSYINDSLLL
jgi:hypothetical protein